MRNGEQKMTDIQKSLMDMQDLEYRDFNSSLLPGVPKESVIGVRIPEIRKYARTLYKTGEWEKFITELPHTYYEENALHMILLCNIKDYDTCIKYINEFLPYVDNWAVCDSGVPDCFKKNLDKLMTEVKVWIKSDRTYTVRYAVGVLMRLFLDEHFDKRYLAMAAGVESEGYYVNMMVAWYFATALAKQWDSTIAYIEDRKLTPWVHNKTIQKAVESYRITPQQKVYLKSMRIKKA